MSHDMSRSAIEHGPDIYEDDEVCDVCDGCDGSGEMRNDFGEEWTCTACRHLDLS